MITSFRKFFGKVNSRCTATSADINGFNNESLVSKLLQTVPKIHAYVGTKYKVITSFLRVFKKDTNNTYSTRLNKNNKGITQLCSFFKLA